MTPPAVRVLVDGDAAATAARAVAGRLPIAAVADVARPVAGDVVVAGCDRAEASARASGVPWVRVTGEPAVDAERVMWLIDAPGHEPAGVAAVRARMAGLRDAEVRRHISLRRANPVRKAIRRVTRRRPAGPAEGPGGADTGIAPLGDAPHRPLGPVPPVSVVIPNRDAPDLLGRVLAGVAATDWPDVETVVVDNGSTDPRTMAMLARPGVVAAPMPIDFNFARLCNRGAAVASGDVIVFLNNDVEIPDPAWLGRMVDAVRPPEVGIAGCVLLYPDGAVQHCGIAIGPDGPRHPHAGERPEDAGEGLEPGPRLAVTAACMAVRAPVFWAIGGFDPLFHRDYNDVDLCLRARTAGFGVRLAAGVALVHHESVSRGRALHPDTVGDWLMMRMRWADVLAGRESGVPTERTP